MNTLTQQKNGFTLVETLIAITVLLLVIIGPITAAQKGIQNAYYASEQLTAIFLAQEAIEAVREFRDRQALIVYYDMDHDNPTASTDDWGIRLPAGCFGSGCAFDITTGSFATCGTYANGCRVLFHSESNQYNHSLGAETPFTRTVTVGSAVGGGWTVTADVSWDAAVFGGSTRNVTLQTWIYDQYQRYED